jgi:hypothetical protein
MYDKKVNQLEIDFEVLTAKEGKASHDSSVRAEDARRERQMRDEFES